MVQALRKLNCAVIIEKRETGEHFIIIEENRNREVHVIYIMYLKRKKKGNRKCMHIKYTYNVTKKT